MFVISIEYKVPLEKIDPFIEEHFAYLKKYYEEQLFIVSGRKEPRTGGVILVRNADREYVQSVMEQDPFYRESLADYQLTEFIPGTIAEGFEQLAQ